MPSSKKPRIDDGSTAQHVTGLANPADVTADVSSSVTSDVICDIPPCSNNLVCPMLTDMYQLTMCYAYWKADRHNLNSNFELFFRKPPFGGEVRLNPVKPCETLTHTYLKTQTDTDRRRQTDISCVIRSVIRSIIFELLLLSHRALSTILRRHRVHR